MTAKHCEILVFALLAVALLLLAKFDFFGLPKLPIVGGSVLLAALANWAVKRSTHKGEQVASNGPK